MGERNRADRKSRAQAGSRQLAPPPRLPPPPIPWAVLTRSLAFCPCKRAGTLPLLWPPAAPASCDANGGVLIQPVAVVVGVLVASCFSCALTSKHLHLTLFGVSSNLKCSHFSCETIINPLPSWASNKRKQQLNRSIRFIWKLGAVFMPSL